MQSKWQLILSNPNVPSKSYYLRPSRAWNLKSEGHNIFSQNLQNFLWEEKSKKYMTSSGSCCRNSLESEFVTQKFVLFLMQFYTGSFELLIYNFFIHYCNYRFMTHESHITFLCNFSHLAVRPHILKECMLFPQTHLSLWSFSLNTFLLNIQERITISLMS